MKDYNDYMDNVSVDPALGERVINQKRKKGRPVVGYGRVLQKALVGLAAVLLFGVIWAIPGLLGNLREPSSPLGTPIYDMEYVNEVPQDEGRIVVMFCPNGGEFPNTEHAYGIRFMWQGETLASIEFPPNPMRNGYVFSGWQIYGGIMLESVNIVVNEDMSLEAIWLKYEDTPPPESTPYEVPDTDTNEQPELDTQIQILSISIDLASEALLNGFGNLHEVDYGQAVEARGGTAGEIEGHTIAIWADVPLQELALLSFGNYFIGDDVIFIPTDTFGQIDILPVGDAFVISSYIGWGTFPWSGVTFVDEYGTKRYFLIQESMDDSQGAFMIREFENRTDELPEDWQPWW